MQKDSKIYVAGHNGLVGSAIVRRLLAAGYLNIICKPHADLDLTNQDATNEFFYSTNPDYVFLAAAKVGGIFSNNKYRAQFIYTNLMIQTNVINAAYKTGVKKLLFMGSSCIYPKMAPQPLREEYLLTGLLESTNEPYAIAKIAGIKMCAAYNQQYKTNYISVMPTNVYGPGDNYDSENSHVIPALIKKLHIAKVEKSSQMIIWGTGKPKREFIYSDDLADACVFLMERYNASEIGEFINVGVGTDTSVADIAKLIADIVGFDGAFTFDMEKPDGTPRKVLDVSRIQTLGWSARTSLYDGLSKSYRDYVMRYEKN